MLTSSVPGLCRVIWKRKQINLLVSLSGRSEVADREQTGARLLACSRSYAVDCTATILTICLAERDVLSLSPRGRITTSRDQGGVRDELIADRSIDGPTG